MLSAAFAACGADGGGGDGVGSGGGDCWRDYQLWLII